MSNSLISLYCFIKATYLNKKEKGASAVEYGLLLAGIAVAIMAAVFALGPTISDLFSTANASIAAGPKVG